MVTKLNKWNRKSIGIAARMNQQAEFASVEKYIQVRSPNSRGPLYCHYIPYNISRTGY
jgi:hypothetical protein